MTMRIDTYATVVEANHKIAGGITGGPLPNKGLGTYKDLVGKTLTFTAPAGNKTFTQPAGKLPGEMSFQDVKTQLEAAIANLRVVPIDGKIGFEDTAGASVTLGAVNEPARTILGFENNKAISGRFLNGPGGAVPKFWQMVAEFGQVYITVEV